MLKKAMEEEESSIHQHQDAKKGVEHPQKCEERSNGGEKKQGQRTLSISLTNNTLGNPNFSLRKQYVRVNPHFLNSGLLNLCKEQQNLLVGLNRTELSLLFPFLGDSDKTEQLKDQFIRYSSDLMFIKLYHPDFILAYQQRIMYECDRRARLYLRKFIMEEDEFCAPNLSYSLSSTMKSIESFALKIILRENIERTRALENRTDEYTLSESDKCHLNEHVASSSSSPDSIACFENINSSGDLEEHIVKMGSQKTLKNNKNIQDTADGLDVRVENSTYSRSMRAINEESLFENDDENSGGVKLPKEEESSICKERNQLQKGNDYQISANSNYISKNEIQLDSMGDDLWDGVRSKKMNYHKSCSDSRKPDEMKSFEKLPCVFGTEQRMKCDIEMAESVMRTLDKLRLLRKINPLTTEVLQNMPSEAKRLDHILTYLRFVHGYCYYTRIEDNNIDRDINEFIDCYRKEIGCELKDNNQSNKSNDFYHNNGMTCNKSSIKVELRPIVNRLKRLTESEKTFVEEVEKSVKLVKNRSIDAPRSGMRHAEFDKREAINKWIVSICTSVSGGGYSCIFAPPSKWFSSFEEVRHFMRSKDWFRYSNILFVVGSRIFAENFQSDDRRVEWMRNIDQWRNSRMIPNDDTKRSIKSGEYTVQTQFSITSLGIRNTVQELIKLLNNEDTGLSYDTWTEKFKWRSQYIHSIHHHNIRCPNNSAHSFSSIFLTSSNERKESFFEDQKTRIQENHDSEENEFVETFNRQSDQNDGPERGPDKNISPRERCSEFRKVEGVHLSKSSGNGSKPRMSKSLDGNKYASNTNELYTRSSTISMHHQNRHFTSMEHRNDKFSKSNLLKKGEILSKSQNGRKSFQHRAPYYNSGGPSQKEFRRGYKTRYKYSFEYAYRISQKTSDTADENYLNYKRKVEDEMYDFERHKDENKSSSNIELECRNRDKRNEYPQDVGVEKYSIVSLEEGKKIDNGNIAFTEKRKSTHSYDMLHVQEGRITKKSVQKEDAGQSFHNIDNLQL